MNSCSRLDSIVHHAKRCLEGDNASSLILLECKYKERARKLHEEAMQSGPNPHEFRDQDESNLESKKKKRANNLLQPNNNNNNEGSALPKFDPEKAEKASQEWLALLKEFHHNFVENKIENRMPVSESSGEDGDDDDEDDEDDEDSEDFDLDHVPDINSRMKRLYKSYLDSNVSHSSSLVSYSSTAAAAAANIMTKKRVQVDIPDPKEIIILPPLHEDEFGEENLISRSPWSLLAHMPTPTSGHVVVEKRRNVLTNKSKDLWKNFQKDGKIIDASASKSIKPATHAAANLRRIVKRGTSFYDSGTKFGNVGNEKGGKWALLRSKSKDIIGMKNLIPPPPEQTDPLPEHVSRGLELRRRQVIRLQKQKNVRYNERAHTANPLIEWGNTRPEARNIERVSEIAELFVGTHFYSSLSKLHRESILMKALMFECPDQEHFFIPGPSKELMYIIISGGVEALQPVGTRLEPIRTLGVGDCFGASGMKTIPLTMTNRNTIFRSLGWTRCLTLSEMACNRLFMDWGDDDSSAKFDALRQLPALSIASDQVLKKIVHLFKLSRYPKGATIYTQFRDRNRMVYIIVQGSVNLHCHTMIRDQNEKKKYDFTLCQLGPMEFFGEMEIFQKNIPIRMFSATCATDVVLLEIQKAYFIDQMPDDVLRGIWQYSQARIYKMNSRTKLVLKTLEQYGWYQIDSKECIFAPLPRFVSRNMIPPIVGPEHEALWLPDFLESDGGEARQMRRKLLKAKKIQKQFWKYDRTTMAATIATSTMSKREDAASEFDSTHNHSEDEREVVVRDDIDEDIVDNVNVREHWEYMYFSPPWKGAKQLAPTHARMLPRTGRILEPWELNKEETERVTSRSDVFSRTKPLLEIIKESNRTRATIKKNAFLDQLLAVAE